MTEDTGVSILFDWDVDKRRQSIAHLFCASELSYFVPSFVESVPSPPAEEPGRDDQRLQGKLSGAGGAAQRPS